MYFLCGALLIQKPRVLTFKNKAMKPILLNTYENESDFVICVWHCVMYYAVTIYDSIKQTHGKGKTFADRETAEAYAKDLNSKYHFI